MRSTQKQEEEKLRKRLRERLNESTGKGQRGSTLKKVKQVRKAVEIFDEWQHYSTTIREKEKTLQGHLRKGETKTGQGVIIISKSSGGSYKQHLHKDQADEEQEIQGCSKEKLSKQIQNSLEQEASIKVSRQEVTTEYKDMD